VADIMVAPSVKLPEGWRHASALQTQGQDTGGVAFRTVSLEQLVDSPLIAGRHFREVALAPDVSPPHYLDMVADAPENLLITPSHIEELSRLVRQSGALFGGRHYDSFRFLVTLSDRIAGGAVDHHQSLDNRRPARFLTDEGMLTRYGGFIPHDFVHSWNGKYRRPEGMTTPNFQVPVDGSGLWVYEGLTDYVGSVLSARAGIWNREQYLDMLAESAAYFSHRAGRRWRDLQDTATMAMALWEKGGGAYDNLRRNGFDFYGEGGLIWLDVDVAIRNASGGRKSLDDFLARFHGGTDSGAEVRPYSFEQLVAALDSVTPGDWAGFLNARLHSLAAEAPLGGIAGGGYRLVYRDQPSAWSAANGSKAFEYSIAMSINNSGAITDVIDGGIAAQAGFVPGMKIVTVNGTPYTTAAMKQAIHAGRSGGAIEFALETGAVLRLDYHGGERYPALERVPGTPDRLAEIILPRQAPCGNAQRGCELAATLSADHSTIKEPPCACR
jgi:predicted metalloprotease with PDZ domain